MESGRAELPESTDSTPSQNCFEPPYSMSPGWRSAYSILDAEEQRAAVGCCGRYSESWLVDTETQGEGGEVLSRGSYRACRWVRGPCRRNEFAALVALLGTFNSKEIMSDEQTRRILDRISDATAEPAAES